MFFFFIVSFAAVLILSTDTFCFVRASRKIYQSNYLSGVVLVFKYEIYNLLENCDKLEKYLFLKLPKAIPMVYHKIITFYLANKSTLTIPCVYSVVVPKSLIK